MRPFTGLVRLDEDRVVLALPEFGMPWIVQMFARGGDGVDGYELLLSRPSRINGMDEAGAGAPFLPTGGMGHFRWPAIVGHREGRDFILQPSGWSVEMREEGAAASLYASDAVAGVALRLDLHFNDLVLESSITLTNTGISPYTLERCMAGTVLVNEGLDTISSFGANWGREFHEHVESAPARTWVMENRRGRTSHDRFPGLVLRSKGDGSGEGETGIHLGWSGNHVMVVDPTDDGRYLIHAGELFEPGEMILGPGESYTSPVMYAAREAGFGGAGRVSSLFWAHVRQSIVKWPGGAMRPRPVLLNTWEGNYFNHDVEALKAQASAAAALGIERFVLDDGWFGRRDDDTTSLGDWFIDARKYPNGLKPLIDHVTGLGMEFGLWFEPEMVNEDSDLYRAHPDWVLQVKGRPLLRSRNQLVLDLSRRDVSEFLFSRLTDVLGNHAISYVKWDMNRDLTHAGGADGKAATARQTRAFYALVDRVRAAHPSVEIESCASGGGRADYGALKRTHRVWTSDCTDPLERLTIQRGARMFLPPEITGTHVSPSPNHQTHRHHSLSFRAIVAFFGHLGVELNPLTLSEAERSELAAWIALHKSLRSILHHPDNQPIDLAIVDGRYAFGVRVVENGEVRILLAVAQATFQTREHPTPLRLPDCSDEGQFTITRLGPGEPPFVRSLESQNDLFSGRVPVSGGLIERHGLPIPQLFPQSAILLDIRTTGGNHG